MSTYYRPAIQNGRISKRARQPVPAAAATASRLTQAFNAMPRAISLPQVQAVQLSGVMMMLIVCGLLVGAGFVYGLSRHFTTGAMVRHEVQLKSNLDQANSEQRNLQIKYARATSPDQLEQRQAGTGLAPLKLDQAELKIATAKAGRTEKAKRKAQPRRRGKESEREPVRFD